MVEGNFNTHVTAGDHDAVSDLDDFIQVFNTRAVLYLCDDLNLFTAVDVQQLPELFNILLISYEGGCDEVDILLDAEDDVASVLLADEYLVNIHTGDVDRFL